MKSTTAIKGEKRRRAGYLEGSVSIAVNTPLFALKYYFGVLFNSIAVVADSIHTLSDSATSLALILGFKVAGKPADREHPFGHGRAEDVTALVIGTLLGVAGFEFAASSYEKLASRIPLEYSDILVLVMAISTLVKLLLGLWALWLGKRFESEAITGDAWHHLSDAAASGLLALALYVGRSHWWLDGVLGLAVSALIVYTSAVLVYRSSSSLLGKAPSKAEVRELIEVVKKACPEARRVHHVHFHRYGDHVEVTLHVELPGEMSLKDAHEVATRVENAIRKELGYEATVHVEAAGEKPRDHVD